MWRRPDNRLASDDTCRYHYSGQHVTAGTLKTKVRPRVTQDFPLAPLLHVLGVAYREAGTLENE